MGGMSLRMGLRHGGRGTSPPAEPAVETIELDTSGASFAPRITVASGAVVTWCFDVDGDPVQSSSLSPSVTWETAAKRTHTLTVTPWSSLRSINVGYDHGDGGYTSSWPDGWEPLADLAQQNVTAIRRLTYATGLRGFAASNNTALTFLDFTGLAALVDVEVYYCEALTTCALARCMSLRRICAEHAPLAALDLSDCTAIVDVRNRGSAHPATYAAPIWPATVANLYHLCIGTTMYMTSLGNLSSCPALVECWIWAAWITGTWSLNAPLLQELRANVCRYSVVDVSQCPVLRLVELQDNRISDPDDIDAILAALAAGTVENGTVDLRNLDNGTNAAPSAAGLAAKATLEGRGWTVQVAT